MQQQQRQDLLEEQPLIVEDAFQQKRKEEKDSSCCDDPSLSCAYQRMLIAQPGHAIKDYRKCSQYTSLLESEYDSPTYICLYRPLRLLSLAHSRRIKGPMTWFQWTRHSLHRILINILVSWTFLGWFNKAMFSLTGQDFPMIPGWFEVSTSARTSIPSGVALSLISTCSFIFAQFYFRKHRHYLMFLSNNVCPDAPEEVAEQVRKYVRYAWIYAGTTSILARLTNILIAAISDSENNFLINQPYPWVIFDTVWTLLAYFVSVFANSYIAAYMTLVCEVHILHTRAFALFVVTLPNERCVKTTVSKHIEMSRLVNTTAGIFQPYAAMVGVLCGVGFVATVVDAIILKPDPRVALRVLYIFWVCLPPAYALYKGARVATEVQDLLTVINRLPPRPNLEESGFLNTYFAAAKEDGRVGISICGITIQLRHLARVGYLLFVFALSMLQYRLSSSRES